MRYHPSRLLYCLAVSVAAFLLLAVTARSGMSRMRYQQETARPLMGAGVIPRNFEKAEQVDWQDAFERLREAGELAPAFVAWRDSPENAGEIPQTVRAFCAAIGPTYGLTPIVALGFTTDGGKTPLIATAANPTNDWTNGDARARFRRTAVAVAREFKPHFLALGGEVNTYREHHPEDFDRFVTLYHECYQAVKQVSPDTRVFTIFQLETLRGLTGLFGGQRQPAWDLLERFEPHLDLAAFTTYPGLIYQTPEEIPDDYYQEILSHTERPIAFTEIGWMSAERFEGRSAILNDTGWASSEEEQLRFLRRFRALTTPLAPEIAVWCFLHDLPARDSPSMPAVFASMGLRRQDGTPKPVWEEWLRWKGERARGR